MMNFKKWNKFLKESIKDPRFDLELDDSPTPSTPSKRGSIPDPKQYSSKYDPVKNAELANDLYMNLNHGGWPKGQHQSSDLETLSDQEIEQRQNKNQIDDYDQFKNRRIQKTKRDPRFDLEIDDVPPTKIIRRPDGSVKSKEWHQDGKQHRLDGPAIIDYYEDGSIDSERWYQDGKRHKLDGPVVINYNRDGSISSEFWYQDGKQHRLDGPAYIIYNQDGSIKSKSWYQDGKFHRLDGPAIISYYSDGTIFSETWYQDGKRHRLDGPAIIDYYEDGSIQSEYWYQDGKRHRLDGPAYVKYYQDGSIKSEYWYLNDKLHRLDGPAVIEYREDGSILFEHWFLNGQEITKEQFEQQTKHLKESKGPYFLFKRYCLK